MNKTPELAALSRCGFPSKSVTTHAISEYESTEPIEPSAAIKTVPSADLPLISLGETEAPIITTSVAFNKRSRKPAKASLLDFSRHFSKP